MMTHVSVMLDEAIRLLQPRDGGIYVDGTLGLGGHAAAILQRSAPTGQLFGFDQDATALALAAEHLAPFGERATLIHANYAQMTTELATRGIDAVDGILLDLGVSSLQFDTAERGFSFRFDAPLDMRMDTARDVPTAADLVNTLAEPALADLLRRYGEEPASRKLARAIVAARPIATTRQLAAVIEAQLPRRGRVHPATRTFQALRIAVNHELDVLAEGLEAGLALLRAGGRLVVISFHSLEDRVVKHRFRSWSQARRNPPGEQLYAVERPALVRRVTRKPLQPDASEVAQNPRSRSARLRAVERLAGVVS